MVGWVLPVLLPLFTLAKLDNLDKETSFLETALPVAMTKGRVDEIQDKSRAAYSEFMYREWVVYHFYYAPITIANCHTWFTEHYRDPLWPGAQWPPWEADEACCGRPPGVFFFRLNFMFHFGLIFVYFWPHFCLFWRSFLYFRPQKLQSVLKLRLRASLQLPSLSSGNWWNMNIYIFRYIEILARLEPLRSTVLAS